MGKTLMIVSNIIILVPLLLFSSPAFAGFENVGSAYDGGGARDVWEDGSYIYLANQGDGLRAYTFNGKTFTNVGHIDDGGTGAYGADVWGDGTYIYLANDEDGLRAYTFNGTNFTNVGHINNGGYAHGVWGDGTYIYLANHYDGLRAYTFNGTTFTNVGHVDPPTGEGEDVWSDGTYIYLANGGGGLIAYTFNGSSFTQRGSIDNGDVAYEVWGDAQYLYLANGSDGLRAYTFDGSTFTNVGHASSGDSSLGVWEDGKYIYLADHANGLKAYIFDGSTFNEIGHIDVGGHGYGVFGDGTYIYLANWSDGIRAYTFNTDLSISNVSETFLDGETATISGSGFGVKSTPEPLFFDSFDSNDSGRQNGDMIRGNKCSHYGSWLDHEYKQSPTYANTNQRTGSTLSSYVQMSVGGAYPSNGAIWGTFSGSHQSPLLVVVWQRVVLSGGSDDDWWQLKHWRITNGDIAEANPDTFIQIGRHVINQDHNPFVCMWNNRTVAYEPWPWYNAYQGYEPPTDTTLHFGSANAPYDGTWYNTIIFAKASTGDGSADGYFKIYSNDHAAGDPAHPYEDAIETYYSANPVPWKNITLGWWIGTYEGSGDPPTAILQFDDVYIDNSWQSVWIGDASSWDNCTHREIQIPTAWSDTSITITVNQGSFPRCEQVYLFVVDADGNVNAQGYPITINKVEGEPPCPPHQNNPQVH
ncbi:MAG: LVIVD repeat-containing protein [Candidatus Hodarchaeota archaeon]